MSEGQDVYSHHISTHNRIFRIFLPFSPCHQYQPRLRTLLLNLIIKIYLLYIGSQTNEGHQSRCFFGLEYWSDSLLDKKSSVHLHPSIVPWFYKFILNNRRESNLIQVIKPFNARNSFNIPFISRCDNIELYVGKLKEVIVWDWNLYLYCMVAKNSWYIQIQPSAKLLSYLMHDQLTATAGNTLRG